MYHVKLRLLLYVSKYSFINQSQSIIFNLSDISVGSILGWNDTGLGKNLVLMIVTGVVSYLFLLAIDFGAIKFFKTLLFNYIPRTYPYTDPSSVDDDVLAEKERIDQMSLAELQSETMVMQNVSKFYGTFCAVNKFSVSIKR